MPVLFGVPSLAYSAPPSRRICTTWQSDSTLFTIVGHMYSPSAAGKYGGLIRGYGRFPSSDSISPVSSPQMYAPAPR